jgi:hypothetical protein
MRHTEVPVCVNRVDIVARVEHMEARGYTEVTENTKNCALCMRITV